MFTKVYISQKRPVSFYCGRRRAGNAVSGFFVLGAEAERIPLILCLGDEIIPSGQHFTDGADHTGDMLDAVYDHVLVITEDDIAVFAHHFDDQFLTTQVS